jgi:hypothetical protein
LIFTSGIASGVNSYAAVLVLGLIGRFWHVTAIPAVLEPRPRPVGVLVEHEEVPFGHAWLGIRHKSRFHKRA